MRFAVGPLLLRCSSWTEEQIFGTGEGAGWEYSGVLGCMDSISHPLWRVHFDQGSPVSVASREVGPFCLCIKSSGFLVCVVAFGSSQSFSPLLNIVHLEGCQPGRPLLGTIAKGAATHSARKKGH